MKQPFVYILASHYHGTLYIGVTGQLLLRAHQHREGLVDGFSKEYGVKRLVWFEEHADFPAAIRRETRLKRWNRAWKIELIERSNPEWRDLWPDIIP